MNENYPFFILGNPRSGTSLFRLMLNNHPDITVPPECGFSDWLYTKLVGEKFNKATYGKFLEEVFLTRKFETWGLDFKEVLKIIEKEEPATYQEFVCAIYRSYAVKLGKGEASLIGDKNNYYIDRLESINAMFPECKKVFIVRDGRDVACSYLELRNKKVESKYSPVLADEIEEISSEWSRSVETMLKWVEKGAKKIKYEELVSNPEGTLADVCDFLGVEYSGGMLNFYKNNDEPESFKIWKGKTFEPLSPSSVGRYKHDLSLHQRKAFEHNCRDDLVALGYQV